jgi:serine/threonine-protein kinase
MEFCGRGTLADQLRRGPLPIDEALLLSDRMCDALAHLHTHGIVHRDVKPSNIGFNDEMSPKLLDFGLAKMLDESLFRAGSYDGSTLSATLTESGGAIRGTPPYLSPEVLVGAAPAPGDDLWSLSVTLLEACTGTNPFRASTPAASAARVMVDDGRVSAATANLPGSVQTLIRTLLDRRPDRRPASAAELQRHIRHVYEGEQHVQIKTGN